MDASFQGYCRDGKKKMGIGKINIPQNSLFLLRFGHYFEQMILVIAFHLI
jgi:hypothetical protein